MTVTQAATGPVIVKRYNNRKLYNTETSSYVTLRDIIAFIVSGREVQVIENKTKNDITGTVLLHALVETELDADGQTETLSGIFKAGGLAKYVQGLKGATNETV